MKEFYFPHSYSHWDMISNLRNAQVFLVAKDFGARIAYIFALLYPSRVAGVVTLGVPYLPLKPPQFEKLLPQGFYFSRWEVTINLCLFFLDELYIRGTYMGL